VSSEVIARLDTTPTLVTTILASQLLKRSPQEKIKELNLIN
jgi:hypothetical protein